MTAYHQDSPRKHDVEGQEEMQQSRADGPLFINSEEKLVEDEVEDVRALYFTVRMLTKEQRQRLVRAPVYWFRIFLHVAL